MHWACLLAVTGKFILKIVTGIDVCGTVFQFQFGMFAPPAGLV
jgi:hypothetical protein